MHRSHNQYIHSKSKLAAARKMANRQQTQSKFVICKLAGKVAGRSHPPLAIYMAPYSIQGCHTLQRVCHKHRPSCLASPAIQWAKTKSYGSSYLLALPPVWQLSYQVLRLPFCMHALRKANFVRELHHMLSRLCICA